MAMIVVMEILEKAAKAGDLSMTMTVAFINVLSVSRLTWVIQRFTLIKNRSIHEVQEESLELPLLAVEVEDDREKM